MPTAKALIDEAVQMLHGFGQTSDQVAVLHAPITPTDTTFTVDAAYGQAVGINPGVVEIDSEQLFVTAVDPSTNIVSLANGFGRGYGSSTATAHAAGAMVVSQPKFPRFSILQQMNEVIGSLYPDLFSVGKYITTATYPQYTYTMPVVPMRILNVRWQDPIQQWHDVAAYSIDLYDGTVKIGDGPMPGRPLQFIYATEPNFFVSESDDFATVTGLPLSTADLLPLGVAMKMAPTFDISRAQLNSIEQSSRSTTVPANTGLNIGTFLTNQFQKRLQNERISLRAQYPPRMRGRV